MNAQKGSVRFTCQQKNTLVCLPGSQDLDLDGWMGHQPRHPLAPKKKERPTDEKKCACTARKASSHQGRLRRHMSESDTRQQLSSQQPRLCMFGLDSRAWPRTPHGVPVPPCVCACPCRCLARLMCVLLRNIHM